MIIVFETIVPDEEVGILGSATAYLSLQAVVDKALVVKSDCCHRPATARWGLFSRILLDFFSTEFFVKDFFFIL
jgi:hypothetical protein